jgi:hypothetical protein
MEREACNANASKTMFSKLGHKIEATFMKLHWKRYST